jgi:DNA-binding SARP family transcriptional activator
MKADAAVGLRYAVSKRYNQLVALLDGELGLEPSAEIRTEYLNLLRQQ